ncbi:uncharacterized protein KGF55_003903 [Candida pseudojiufengensis]|uniref:uncharacterized protein n=1 Tax=Candida pseudojiufengensis TaxID=497109 RepID=UPI002224D5BD|nr:uncharacterized protein KGF55_003903 [Candida pseudojiufengensis]KAI5961586.1 hypothetical protein KGF55_003903 [Candida pseudojiufengensis]
MSFPSPPVLKTTIIQLNKELDPEDNNNNYEILTNNYNNNDNNGNNLRNVNDLTPTSPNLEGQLPNKKKRRRSTANIDSEELAKRKNETKQLHSIIEKRRRIKINREFEALKYIIPACRNCNNNTTNTSGSTSPSSKKNGSSSNSNSSNNGSKIDGMYKLTILKSSVEYILYLHHIIQKQHELITKNPALSSEAQEFDIDFAKVPLDVNQYRNIDVDFNFKDLINETIGSEQHQTQPQSQLPQAKPKLRQNKRHQSHQIIEEEDEENDEEFDSEKQNSEEDELSNNLSSRSSSIAPSTKISSSDQQQQQLNFPSIQKPSLPTPEFTPDMAPILSMLNKYSTTTAQEMRNRKLSNPISPQTFVLKSANPSPFTQPLKSTLTSPSMRGYINSNSTSSNNNNKFSLPDPAITPSNDIPRDNNSTKIFRNKLFISSSIDKRNDIENNNEDENEDGEGDSKLSDQYASKTLLALRKSSIDSLLN